MFLFLFFFGQEACGNLASRPRIEPTPPAFDDKSLTIGPPAESLESFRGVKEIPSCYDFEMGLL